MKSRVLVLWMLAISDVSFAGWGDVYYCNLTSWTSTLPSGEQRVLRAGTSFKFQLNEEKRAMIFDNALSFAYMELRIPAQWHDMLDASETWYAADHSSTLLFYQGSLVHSRVLPTQAVTKHATCSKF